MASHSRTLAWRIPRTEELGGLQHTGGAYNRVTNTFTLTLSLTKQSVSLWSNCCRGGLQQPGLSHEARRGAPGHLLEERALSSSRFPHPSACSGLGHAVHGRSGAACADAALQPRV